MLTLEESKCGNNAIESSINLKRRVILRHKIGKTNSPVQHNSNFSFKVKHSNKNSHHQSNSSSRKATENMGDQEDIKFDNREVLSDSDEEEDLFAANAEHADHVRGEMDASDLLK